MEMYGVVFTCFLFTLILIYELVHDYFNAAFELIVLTVIFVLYLYHDNTIYSYTLSDLYIMLPDDIKRLDVEG